MNGNDRACEGDQGMSNLVGAMSCLGVIQGFREQRYTHTHMGKTFDLQT